jgi:photosystem II stability/assembly factor-like uncharacterized protein
MPVCISPNGLSTYSTPHAPDRLYVGTIKGVAVVEREGQDWQLMQVQLPETHISSLLYDETSRGLFAGVHGHGLHFSSDDGATWERRTRGLTVDHVYSLGGARGPDGLVLYAGTQPAHLYRSSDDGATWNELASLRGVSGIDRWSFPGPPHEGHVKAITVDPRDQDVIYIGIEQGALLKTTDGGRTWFELDQFSSEEHKNYKDIHKVLLRPSNPDELFFSGGEGIFYSADAGETFEQLTDRDSRLGYPDQLLFAPNDESVLFAAGAAHDPSFWFESRRAESIVMKSLDSGRTWQPANSGLPDPMRANIEAMTIAGSGDEFVIFIGTTDGELYQSADGGESWALMISHLPPISKVEHYLPLQPAT